EPGGEDAGEPRLAGPLHDIEGSAEQHIAAEGEDDGGGMEGAQPPEIREGEAEVQRREGELGRDIDPGEETAHRPEHRSDNAGLDDCVVVASRDPALSRKGESD